MKYRKCALQGSALIVGLALLAASSSSFGNQATSANSPAGDEQVAMLPELTVASHFIGVPYDTTGVSTTIIDSKNLEKQGLATLADGLARSPGVYLLDGGSTNQRGSAGHLVIRGMNASTYTLAMIDGMRVSDANQYADNLFGLGNLFTADQVEVVRGSQGAVYGAGAVGGVVAMNTPEGEGKPGAKIFAEAGSFGSVTTYATSSGTIKDLSYFVGVGYETTQNDPDYEGAQNYLNPSLKTNDFYHYSEALSLGYRPNDKVKLTLTYRRDDSNLESPLFDPGPYGSNMIYSMTDETRVNLVTAKLDAEVTKLWTTSFMTGYYDQHYSQEQPTEYMYAYQFNSAHKKVQMEWRNEFKWTKKTSTILGTAWDRTTFDSTGFDVMSEAYNIETNQLENTYGFFAEQLWQPTEGLDLNFAARLDHDTVWGNQFTWRYDNSWKITGKDSPTRLFGSVGSGFRAPTFFEQYANYQGAYGLQKGNPDLSVAKSLGGDLGIEQRISKSHYVTLTGFWTRIDDQIAAYTAPDYSYTSWENTSHATSAGLETALKGNFNDGWNTGYTLAYTYTLPKNDNNHQLALTARHTFAADLHTSPIKDVTTGIGLVAGLNRTNWSSVSDGDGSFIYDGLDDYIALRWYARWQVSETLSLHIRVENLCNEKFMTQYSPYDNIKTLARGTAVFGGLTLEF